MGTLSQRKNIPAYIEMYNNIDFLYQAIRDHAETKNHMINDIIIDVDDETKATYVIILTAKDETGKKYKVNGSYTIKELENLNIIEKW